MQTSKFSTMMNRKTQFKALCEFPFKLFSWSNYATRSSSNTYATTTGASRIAPVNPKQMLPKQLLPLLKRNIDCRFCVPYWKRDPICYSPCFLVSLGSGNLNLYVSRNPIVRDLSFPTTIEPQYKTAYKSVDAAKRIMYCMFGGSTDEETSDMDHDSTDSGDDHEGNNDGAVNQNEEDTDTDTDTDNDVAVNEDDEEDTREGKNDVAVNEDDEEDTVQSNYRSFANEDDPDTYVDITTVTVSDDDDQNDSDDSNQNEITDADITYVSRDNVHQGNIAAIANIEDAENTDTDSSTSYEDEEDEFDETDIDGGFADGKDASDGDD